MTADLYHINRYGVLRIDFILVLILAFLVRQWWMSLAVLMSRSPELMGEFFRGEVWKYQLAAEVPALVACIAALRRKPTGGIIARWLWRASPVLLSLTAITSGVLLFSSPGWHFDIGNLDQTRFIQLLLTAGSLAYVFGVGHVRRAFGEFPAPPPPEETPQQSP